jgi:gliding motility-associated-like protein
MNRHSLFEPFENLNLNPQFRILFQNTLLISIASLNPSLWILEGIYSHKYLVRQIIYNFVFLFLTFVLIRVQIHAQSSAPKFLTQKTIGGSSNETLNSAYPTSDGGYLMGGQTSSSNGDVQGSRKGLADAWVVKTDAAGTILWQTDLAGSKDDIVTSVKETSDQGAIVLGYTASTDGDFLSNHGTTDVFVTKLSKTGSIEWIRCFGGTLEEKSGEIMVGSEGGYLFTGSAKSYNGDLLSKFPVDSDAWVVKITTTGMMSWQQLFTGIYSDFCKAVKQMPNKNYVVVSNIGTASGTNQREDIFISVLLPTNGNVLNQYSYGGSRQDLAASIETTPDGGFVIIGKSSSNNGTLLLNQGNFDIWILKMSSTYAMQWQKTFGGSEFEGGTGSEAFGNIKPTDDGGYIFASSTNSKNGDVKNTPFSWSSSTLRVWVVKLTCKQEIQWQKIFGGNAGDYGVFVEQKSDKSYVIAGNANSNDGDVSGNKGGQDFWTFKLDKDPKIKANLAISGPLEFCEGNSIKLNADLGPQYKYQWQRDGVDIAGEIFSRLTVTKTGDYKVLISPKDCPKPEADTSVKVVVNQKPKVGLPKDTVFCKNPMVLSANNLNGASYQWSSGEITPSINPTTSGTYSLKLKFGGCEVDSSVNVKVSSAPVVNMKSQIEDCFDTNKPYILSAGTDLTLRYRWLPNNETSNNINVSKSGVYKVKVSNNDGCVTEKSVQMIQHCTSKFYAANIFTPNGDGDNDVFWIVAQDVTDYELKIFNRWGKMIFMSNSESEVWDGTINSTKAPEGTYSWQLNYRNANQPDDILKHSGTILLVR